MLIRWRFRRSDASSDLPLFQWSRVPQGTAGVTITGTAAAEGEAASSTAPGTVSVAGVATPSGAPGSSNAPGTAAQPTTVATVLPHDDYDDLRPWWDRRRRRQSEQARIEAMRIEIGMLPKRVAQRVERSASAVVSKASEAIARAEKRAMVRDEGTAFDLVAAYQREYRRVFRGVLAQARADDLAETFKAEVMAQLRTERRREVEADDAELLDLIKDLI